MGMGCKSGAKVSFLLRLFCLFSIFFFTTGSLCKSYALNDENDSTESDGQNAKHMEALLSMDIRDLMNIEVVSATRNLIPLRETAENITVITAKDIEFMNAHTLAEVLNSVTGVQIEWQGAQIGALALPIIQGSEFYHVTVLVDGVPINNLNSESPELFGTLPVQIIDRIEIIKGPASSTWGSALGGVINIITKSGVGADKFQGTLSTSYGEENTGDYRAEIYGAKDKFSYYLFAGNLQTSGFQPNYAAHTDRVFAKLNYNFSPDTQIKFSIYQDIGRAGEGDEPSPPANPTTSLDVRGEHTMGNLSFQSKITSDIKVNLSLWTLEQKFNLYENQIRPGSEVFFDPNHEITNGASAQLVWIPGSGAHTIVVGTDYSRGIDMNPYLVNSKQELTKYAGFVSDTILCGDFSVTPGFRYDSTDRFGDMASPTIGITYKLTDNTLLRATAARGFNVPSLGEVFYSGSGFIPNQSLTVEKVWSYQAGVETTALQYVWLKAGVFRYDISDALEQISLPDGNLTTGNVGKVRRQGIEAEIKTVPVCNTSLFAGAEFIGARDLVAQTPLIGDIPSFAYNVGIKYDDKSSFKAILQGNYTWWDEPASNGAIYNAMIFDLSATKTVYKHNSNSVDLFVSAHNIFDGTQEQGNYYPNAGRWFEGGVRYKF
jgi:vitamin B12 transporter